MNKRKIFSTIRYNRANLYLLHEAVEGLVFAFEALAATLDGEAKKLLEYPLIHAKDALKRVKRNTEKLERSLKDKPES